MKVSQLESSAGQDAKLERLNELDRGNPREYAFFTFQNCANREFNNNPQLLLS